MIDTILIIRQRLAERDTNLQLSSNISEIITEGGLYMLSSKPTNAPLHMRCYL